MRITVAGTGYVGLVVGGRIADSDDDVARADVDGRTGANPRERVPSLARPVVVDGRNLHDPATMSAPGFTCLPSGRPEA